MTLGGQQQWLAHTLRANAKQSLMSGDGVINETLVYAMAHGQSNAEIIKEKSPTLNTNHEQPIIAWNGAQITSPQNKGGIFHNVTPTLNSLPTAMVGVRRLTPTECERLQGFPDGWTASQSDTQRYKQLGNAVAVPVVQWIINRIKE